MKNKSIVTLLITFLIGLGLWFVPHSEELSPQAWHLFAIFVTTIIGIILKPLPIGAMAILAISVATITKTLSLTDVLSGFHSEIVWLVIFAFSISRGFIKTGLGERIAYYFVALMGKKTLGLSYGLLVGDLILAPAIPSTTARTGGVIYPIAQGLAKSFGSDPALGTERKIGSFLMKVAYQGSVITSAMFLTAMAANPLLASFTQDAGYSITWGQWALGGVLPGLLSLLVMPWVVYKIYPPEIHDTPHAAEFARNKLKEMGKPSKSEWLMFSVFILLLVLWIFGSLFSIPATVAAMCGLSLLLVLSVLDWKDILAETKAWDTFIWFAILIMLATFLNKLGFMGWFSEQVVEAISGFNPVLAFAILFLVYFYSHYLFASNTAHVGAMFPAFLLVAISLGIPPGFVILTFAFSSSLMGGLTHYGSGPAPLYYGSGYIPLKAWWRVGFLLSLVNIAIWIGVGSLWWKLLGYY